VTLTRTWFLGLLVAAGGAVSCGSSSSSPSRFDRDAGSAGAAGAYAGSDAPALDASPDALDASNDSGACPRAPGPADAARSVVVSHPYDASGQPSSDFEVLALATDGTLSRPGAHFSLGATSLGHIAFTPDGRVGLVAEDDGTLGVFGLDASGAPTVIDASYKGSFYASGVMVGPSGSTAYVLDDEWRDNGGGIYALDIRCDGSLANERLVTPSKLAGGLDFLPNDPSRALLAATDVLNSPAANNADLLKWGEPPELLSGAPAFPDDEAIVSSLGVTHDGRYALIGDNNQFYSSQTLQNRVAVVAVANDTLNALQILTPIDDPYDIVTSPFDDGAIVVSGFGNAIWQVGYDASSPSAPFQLQGELAYQGTSPQLPGDAVSIRRGPLSGLVLIAENTALREVSFAANGAVTDLGPYSLGSGTDSIPGAIGVQP
jgi:hypothetical protein